jgi:hypothetical protein
MKSTSKTTTNVVADACIPHSKEALRSSTACFKHTESFVGAAQPITGLSCCQTWMCTSHFLQLELESGCDVRDDSRI